MMLMMDYCGWLIATEHRNSAYLDKRIATTRKATQADWSDPHVIERLHHHFIERRPGAEISKTFKISIIGLRRIAKIHNLDLPDYLQAGYCIRQKREKKCKVQQLRELGWSFARIAIKLKMNKNTAKRWYYDSKK